MNECLLFLPNYVAAKVRTYCDKASPLLIYSPKTTRLHFFLIGVFEIPALFMTACD